jgi:hypothetical protein
MERRGGGQKPDYKGYTQVGNEADTWKQCKGMIGWWVGFSLTALQVERKRLKEGDVRGQEILEHCGWNNMT